MQDIKLTIDNLIDYLDATMRKTDKDIKTYLIKSERYCYGLKAKRIIDNEKEIRFSIDIFRIEL